MLTFKNSLSISLATRTYEVVTTCRCVLYNFFSHLFDYNSEWLDRGTVSLCFSMRIDSLMREVEWICLEHHLFLISLLTSQKASFAKCKTIVYTCIWNEKYVKKEFVNMTWVLLCFCWYRCSLFNELNNFTARNREFMQRHCR